MPENAASQKSQLRTQFNAVAAEYDAGPGCFAYFGRRLVTAAGIEPGHRVLDVASGRGAALFPCAGEVGETGEVIGIDLAEKMVRATNDEMARRGFSARAQIMDAEHLDFSDSTFDRVLCGFGIMFFLNQTRALGECRRVLKAGGRIALSTWRASPVGEIRAAMAALGMQSARPPGWITEADDLSELLAAAGFTAVRVTTDSYSFRYENADDYWLRARGTGMRQFLDALAASDMKRLRDALTERVNPDGPREFYSTATALIAVAHR